MRSNRACAPTRASSPRSSCARYVHTLRPQRPPSVPTRSQRSIPQQLRCALPRRRFTDQEKPPAREPNSTDKIEKPLAPPAPLWKRILTRIDKDSPHPPNSAQWWLDKAIIFTVFGVTGSSTMFFVRPLLTDVLHIEGTWTYLIASILLISPSYTVLLVFFGTLAGRREYFTKIALRMWGRFLPFLREPKPPKSE